MKTQLQQELKDIIKSLYDLDISDIKLDNPPKKDMGDYAFGVFLLAKDLRKAPGMIAAEIKKYIDEQGSEVISWSEVAWPYLNITLNQNLLTQNFMSWQKNRENIALNGQWKTIVIDYIGANVWKPLHIGHMCTPLQGQALVNVYKALGYTVISDSHIGDWGIIFWKLICAYKKWWDEAQLKQNAVDHLLELYIKITAESEIDDTIEQQVRDEFRLLSQWDEDSKKLWADFTKHSIAAMNIQLARLSVHTDYNIGESFYEWIGLAKMEDYPDLKIDMHTIVENLIDAKIATKNDDNSVWVIFSDESKIPSCILQKRDWTHGYLASDLASVKYRMDNWQPEKIVYFVDVRQQLHLQQVFEVSKQANWVWDTQLIHAHNWFISLKDGAMSTRTGRIIKLDKLLDEAESRAEKIILEKRDDISWDELATLSKTIWMWAIIYGYLKKTRETDSIFDWDEFMSFEWNSGPYIQYAYVRARAILEKAPPPNPLLGKEGEDSFAIGGGFETPEEIDLAKMLMNYETILKETAEKNMAHVLAKYCYDLTKSFSGLYNNVHILNETDEAKKNMRLSLIASFTEILKESFSLLGIDMPERM